MDLTDPVSRGEAFLEHHGVKGMKWGVRKDHSISSTTAKTSKLKKAHDQEVTVRQKPGRFVKTSGGKRTVAADDAVKVAASRQLAKKSTTDALSNKQLGEAVARMNLEKQFTKLAKEADRRGRGKKIVDALLGKKGDQPLKGIDLEKATKVAGAFTKAKTAASTTAKVVKPLALA